MVKYLYNFNFFVIHINFLSHIIQNYQLWMKWTKPVALDNNWRDLNSKILPKKFTQLIVLKKIIVKPSIEWMDEKKNHFFEYKIEKMMKEKWWTGSIEKFWKEK